MGKGSSAPPPPPAPDYAGAAQAQGAANVETARVQGRMSNPNIISPLGTQTITYEGDQPTITQKLTPTAEETLAAQQRVQKLLAGLGETGTTQAQKVIGSPFSPTGTAGQGLQTRLDLSNLAQMPVNAGMTGQQAIMARLEPQLQRQQAAMENQLANQGITPGSEAYRVAQTQAAQNRNDLLSQAALQGISLDRRTRSRIERTASNLGSAKCSATTRVATTSLLASTAVKRNYRTHVGIANSDAAVPRLSRAIGCASPNLCRSASARASQYAELWHSIC